MMKSIGKADINRTVEDVMRERAKNGAKYLDLATGEFMIEVNEPVEIVMDIEEAKKKSKMKK